MSTLDHISSHPLDWPDGVSRTEPYARHSWPGRTSDDFGDTKRDLVEEAESIADTTHAIVVSTNQPTYQDGGRDVPYAPSSRGRPDDPGVAVYVVKGGSPRVFACDQYETLEGNMRAVRLTLKQLRRIEKRGVNEGQRAYQGFQQLPPEGGTTDTHVPMWWDILDVSRNASPQEVKDAYREKAKNAHPDQGGTTKQWNRLRDAYQEGLEAVS